MKAAHTPGPWAVNPFNAQVDSAVNGAPVPVCQMLWPTSLRTEAETEANACLIAAAPELLEALLWYVAEDDVMESMACNEYWLAGRERARAVIAKATGAPA